MNAIKKFDLERERNIRKQGKDKKLSKLAIQFMTLSLPHKYSYNFDWMGRPIIQLPQDIIAMQEIIWKVKPDLIIETGIAHGGSLIFYASMLELLGGKRRVLGIDIDIRKHNRTKIEKHPMFKRITMMEGSSIDDRITNKVYTFAKKYKRILITLDSFHTHGHVEKELELYAPLVKKGSYLVVFDTAIEDLENNCFQDRPWGKGNNPKTAVWKFLKNNDRFIVDKEIESKLMMTVAPDGYLKCVKN